MTLYEQQEILVKRAMKPHPRLQIYDQEQQIWLYRENDDEDTDWVYIHLDEAHDLITMHALRWAMGGKFDDGLYANVFDRRTPYCHVVSGVEVSKSATLLEAVIIATKHLENKDE